ncbi:MAG: OmpA family protein [Myxococcales bacterium]|nr:MAG: OmpA family protein [Myxococcales bacterium]
MQTKFYNRFSSTLLKLSSLAVLGSVTASAAAAEGAAAVSLSTSGASATSSAEAASPPAPSTDAGELGPEPNLWELGLFGGLMFPSSSHALVRPGREQQPFETAGELGARVAYFPLAFLGLEVEGAGMPSKLEDGSSGGLFAARGHGILQVPMGRFTPFALGGGGVLGGASNRMGTDRDPAIHFGLGAKYAMDESISVRLDLRDTLTQKYAADQGTQTHHPEVLLGFSFTLERHHPDRDGDGFADFRDDCPAVPGTEQGCPPPIADEDEDGVADDADRCKGSKGAAPSGCPDTDGDGKLDQEDECPRKAANTADGCPLVDCPIKDRDGDGRTDATDKCPDEPAPTADGCIDRDPDRDGILEGVDKCPDKAETANGFQDQDGCPDEVPAAIKKFSGVIRGINFARDKAEIFPGSKPLLDEAAKVMKEFPELKLEISGHTDTQGAREHNLDLSKRRADSVKAYLVSQGVDETRLFTRGAGPDEPIADNKIEAGRAQNRRIEFKNVSK